MILSQSLLLAALGAAAPVKPASVKPAPAKAEEYSSPLYPATTAPITVPLVLARLTTFDEGLKAMTCDFAQVVRWRQSGVAQIVSGTLEYKRPELLHIEQTAPEPQTMVADGKWLWIWRRSTEQVIQTKLEDWKRSEPLAQGLLDFGGYAEMLKRYEVSIATVSAPDASGHRTLQVALRPRAADKSESFELKLKLSTKDFFPYETELRAGQVEVRSTFKGVRYNPVVADERFRFTPPAGADVFEDFKPPKVE